VKLRPRMAWMVTQRGMGEDAGAARGMDGGAEAACGMGRGVSAVCGANGATGGCVWCRWRHRDRVSCRRRGHVWHGDSV
jgi:hypothetical protein